MAGTDGGVGEGGRWGRAGLLLRDNGAVRHGARNGVAGCSRHTASRCYLPVRLTALGGIPMQPLFSPEPDPQSSSQRAASLPPSLSARTIALNKTHASRPAHKNAAALGTPHTPSPCIASAEAAAATRRRSHPCCRACRRVSALCVWAARVMRWNPPCVWRRVSTPPGDDVEPLIHEGRHVA